MTAGEAEDGFTTFYHGTSQDYAAAIKQDGIDLGYGRPNADFETGFYMSTSKEVAESRAKELYKGKAIDVVEFKVPNSELDKLSGLKFGSADDAFQDFTRFHKTYSPEALMHGGEVYDVVSGPMVSRIKGKEVFTWPNKVQTSIHTPRSVGVFNNYMVR